MFKVIITIKEDIIMRRVTQVKLMDLLAKT